MKRWLRLLPAVFVALGLGGCEREHAAHGVATGTGGFEQVINWRVRGNADIVNLRIPLAYIQLPREWLGRTASPEALDDLLNRTVDRDRFAFEALLPGLRGKSAEGGPVGDDVLTGVVESRYSDQDPSSGDPLAMLFDFYQGLFRTPARNDCEWADVHYEGSRFASNKDVVCGIRPASVATPDQGAFGLDAVGYSPAFRSYQVRYGKAWQLSQLFYRRGPGGRYDVVIQCGTAAGQGPSRDAEISPVLCNQTYYSEWLDARVRLTYPRSWLKDWQSLQGQSERLLRSFVRK